MRIWPDDFIDPKVYVLPNRLLNGMPDQWYAKKDGNWFLLWGSIPDGGMQAEPVTDRRMFDLLNSKAVARAA